MNRVAIAKVLDVLRPVLWLWIIGGLVLWFGGDRLIGAGWSKVGMLLVGAYFFLYAVLVALDKPERCKNGHTDIGYYYGRWSCRTCYRQRHRKK